ncbi:MAG: hypothetical protein ACR2FV_16840 [Ornithinimicrobium sp.]|uniref:hypothetical protein n=1 Tax=Ornithinimicrobium sp. TaxID=1977084 RepID=UPI003D9B37BD
MLRRIDPGQVLTYEELFTWLDEGELLDGTDNEGWARDWERADAHSFQVAAAHRPSHAGGPLT